MEEAESGRGGRVLSHWKRHRPPRPLHHFNINYYSLPRPPAMGDTIVIPITLPFPSIAGSHWNSPRKTSGSTCCSAVKSPDCRYRARQAFSCRVAGSSCSRSNPQNRISAFPAFTANRGDEGRLSTKLGTNSTTGRNDSGNAPTSAA